VLRDMFPDVYRDRAQARSFRERHAGTLRDTTAVRRVLDRVVADTTHVIDHAEVDDWIAALGLARFLFTRRRVPRQDEVGMWYQPHAVHPRRRAQPAVGEPVTSG
jgi:uncharacterized protein DUF2017